MTVVPRLKAGIFVRALIRRVQVEGASAFVIRSGAEEAGSIILKVAKLDGSVLVLNQARNAKGELVWAQALGGWTGETRASDEHLTEVGVDVETFLERHEVKNVASGVASPALPKERSVLLLDRTARALLVVNGAEHSPPVALLQSLATLAHHALSLIHI